MVKILTLLGTRPEAIKLAPVIYNLKKHPEQIQSVVCVTGQHRQMLDQVLALFDIQPDYDLALMRPNQSLAQITAHAIANLDTVIGRETPDWLLVQGDTTTVMAAALVGFYHKVKIGHVEAGLRTYDKFQPFPEEINRRITDLLGDLFFAPTESARQHLLSENVPAAKIYVTGNTGIDALHLISKRDYIWEQSPIRNVPQNKRLILVTAHRRENFGESFRNLCFAIRDLALRYKDDCHFVYPVHLNPNVQTPVHEILTNLPNVSLLEPVDYSTMVQLMKRSTLILTDSGGIQEEAPSLGIPVLVLREVTERPEAVECGVARLVGTNRDVIVHEAARLLDDVQYYQTMARVTNLYGDGHAAERIVAALCK